MSDLAIPAPLARKVGPFPVYLWALIIVGGVVLGRYAARSMGGGGDDDVLGVLDPLADLGPAQATVPGGTRLSPSIPEPNVPLPESNDAWGVEAADYLVSAGKATGYTATQVIARYLQGLPLTAGEQGIVDAAVAYLGTPPQGAPIALPIAEPAPTPAPPAPAPTPAPPAPAPTPAPPAPAPPAPSPSSPSTPTSPRRVTDTTHGGAVDRTVGTQNPDGTWNVRVVMDNGQTYTVIGAPTPNRTFGRVRT